MGFTRSPEETVAKGIEAGRAAVARDDKDPMAHFGLGRALTVPADLAGAIAELEIAVELNPNFALAYLGLGVALTHAGRSKEALDALDTAIRLTPHDPLLWTMEHMRAFAHVELGEYELAVADARRACRHPNTGVWSYLTLASALFNLGRDEEAKQVFARLYALWPDFSAARFTQMIHPGFRREGRWLHGLRKAGLEVPDEAG